MKSPLKQLQARVASVIVVALVVAPMLLVGVNAWLNAYQG
jgi:hypothetical protein